MQDSTSYRNDSQYLSTRQYQDSGNLSSRIQIHQKFSTGQQSWYDFVYELAAIKPETKVLELGCGAASLWRAVMNRLNENTRVLLSDFSPGMIRDAADNLQRDKRFNFVCMNSMNVTFPDQTFDLVVANPAHHVPPWPGAWASGRLLNREKVYGCTNGPEIWSTWIVC